MRLFALSLSLTMCCFVAAIPRSIDARDKQNRSYARKVNAPVELTTTVVRERSCSPDHLSLNLRFTFRNVSAEPVLIDKQSFIARSLISRSLNAANAKQYVTQIRADLFDDSFPLNPGDLSNFVIVLPGKAYDLETEHTRVSFLINDGRPHSKDFLEVGNYFLQVDVATWTYLGDAKEFRRKWKPHGLLWFEGLTSQPMHFAVEPNRQIASCT